MPKTITRDELKRRIDARAPFVLLEALGPRYFAEGHLPGAHQIDHENVAAAAPTLAPDRASPIVVYCASATCRNSHIAAAALERLGYSDVSVYPGGKQDWVEAGLPLVKEVARAI
jgi:rhodanese-related sulfurtransferase